MLNKKIKFAKKTLIIAACIGLTSCSDYLSTNPDDRTTVDQQEKIKELLVAAYPNGSYMFMAETMSDNFDDKKNLTATNNLDFSLYKWEVPVENQQDTPSNYWDECYKAIAQANMALQQIEALKTAESPMDDYKGEALLARAYAHFMLVNLWGKHYNPATAATDLGIPYVTEVEEELKKDYDRNSVEEVYNLIEKDIIEGLELVENNYDKPKFHFTPKAGNAFATRFYLYKGDWDKVIEHANAVLEGSNYMLRDWKAYGSLQHAEIQNLFSSSAENANILIAYTTSSYSRKFASSRFGLSNDKREEIFQAGNPLSYAWVYPIYGTDLYYNIPKFQEFFEYTNINAGIGFVHTPNVLFSTDEVLLARAEAYAMKEDFASALNDAGIMLTKMSEISADNVNISLSQVTSYYPVVENEYTPYYSLTNEQSSFVKFIAELRRREYFFEGLRWFDIKRFNLKVEHKVFTETTRVLEKDDNKRLLQIPPHATAAGIEANPR
ncbi:RagB/SusD family nutrient uptake outer membrane protein [Mesonia hippocampi]|uniref:RagB/SusD family nutrient uptake outer membrane protein n=1 Tax=Mesonia hippocampi TaxID=1628250 RepID=UPI003F964498